MAGIYIHIPFCKQACHYCDFHFSTSLNLKEQMISAICKELELRRGFLKGQRIQTIYFGGGSPSILEAKDIERILNTVHSFHRCELQEVTLEANPDDLSEEKLQSWKSLGIDRLSLGIQSFQQNRLSFYNRAHTAEESLLAIDKARKEGFEKFNLDLIYGYPDTSHDAWMKDLQIALELDPGHLSCYALTVEPNTALGHWAQKGSFKEANDDYVAVEFEILQEYTEKMGYTQYEVSNFAKDGKLSLHNSNYWKHISYLGVGPSAFSFDGEDRGSNVRNNAIYIRKLSQNQIAYESAFLSREDKINEYLLTSLRTIWGADLDYLKSKLNFDLLKLKIKLIEKMNEEGLLLWNEKNVTLTKKGKLLADSVASALFTD
ncbi:radical SAM family heme chaperone HemW [Algoriphagus sp. C2-7]|uniref:Heme chaperone HemW n=1 Tax=Algoriphagus sediminis TaxID=3057113 RepID=A0ABT7YEF2_9BACT|nr:radical SAM family heme chaperone HemW [Algoriphagus sediminis]MDN3204894.1 radical SAM family heme chaperone HemW [Algoriphagus sediminis]